MALTPEQESSRLFKKSLGAGETLLSRQFFEEPVLGGISINPEQIWTDGDLIPNTAPALTNNQEQGVVKYIQLLELQHISGSDDKAYFSVNLKDAIPFNYGDGSYNYDLFKNDGVTRINFGEGDWLVDTSAGLLTFYADNLPSNVSAVNPPKISFYKYIGKKGLSSVGATAGDGLSKTDNTLNILTNPDSVEINSNNQVSLKETITGGRTFSGASSNISILNDGGLKVTNSIDLGTNINNTGSGSFAGGLSVSVINSNSLAFGDDIDSRGSGNFGSGKGHLITDDYGFVTGLSNFSRSRSEFSGGEFGTTYLPSNTTSDRLVNFGNGTSDIDRKDAWTLFKNGAQKFQSRPLSEVSNASSGFFALDENSKPNFFFNGQWNDVTNKGIDTTPVFQTITPSTTYSGVSDVTNVALSQTPTPFFEVEVYVNGQRQTLGETLGSDCWFGTATNAISFANLSQGNTLVWNANGSGFPLDANDRVDLVYKIEV